MWSDRKKAVLLLGIPSAVLLIVLSVLLVVNLLIPYAAAKNSMDPGGILTVRAHADGTVRFEWPAGENIDRYQLQILDPDGAVLFEDETANCFTTVPALESDRALTVRVTGLHGYGKGVRRSETPLEAVISAPAPQIRSLNWQADEAEDTVDIDFDMSEGDLCRVYMAKGDGEPVLAEQLQEGKLQLRFGEGEKYALPDHGEEWVLTFQLERKAGNVCYQGAETEGFTLTREHLLGTDLQVQYTDVGDNSYTFTWNETKGAYYDVRFSEDGGKTWMTMAYIPASSARTYTSPSLTAYTDYTVSVVAVGGVSAQEGEFAAEAEPIRISTDAKLRYSTIWPLMDLSVLAQPGGKETIGTVRAGSAWCLLGQEGDYFEIRFDGRKGYLHSDYCMINAAEYLGNLCIYDITNSYSSRYLVHEYGIDQVSGTVITGYEDVKVGENRYLAPVLYPTAQKLLRAAQAAKAQGYKLKIYDSFRPQNATSRIYYDTFAVMRHPLPANTFTGKQLQDLHLLRGEPYQSTVEEEETEEGTVTETKTFIAYVTLMTNNGEYPLSVFLAPNISRHNYGVALDLTLADLEGNELQMQTSIHDLSWYSIARRNNANANTLYRIMTEAGLHNIYSEWWHFQDNEIYGKHFYQPLAGGVSWQCWVADNHGWRYRLADGSFYANCTQTIDGQSYTFDENGYIGAG